MEAISAFLELIGPVWANDATATLALAVGPQHLNRHGLLHGGALAAVSDLQALILNRANEAASRNVVTVSLATDFLAPVCAGDWLEMAVTLTRETRSLLFTDATMKVGDRIVGRARGIYQKRETTRSQDVSAGST